MNMSSWSLSAVLQRMPMDNFYALARGKIKSLTELRKVASICREFVICITAYAPKHHFVLISLVTSPHKNSLEMVPSITLPGHLPGTVGLVLGVLCYQCTTKE